jgi:hypothetical protein
VCLAVCQFVTVCLSVPSVPVCDAVSLCLSVCLSDATLPLCFSASLPAACRHASAQVSGQVSGRVRVQPGYESSASGWCWVVLGAWCVCGGAVDRLRVCACGSCQWPGRLGWGPESVWVGLTVVWVELEGLGVLI